MPNSVSGSPPTLNRKTNQQTKKGKTMTTKTKYKIQEKPHLSDQGTWKEMSSRNLAFRSISNDGLGQLFCGIITSKSLTEQTSHSPHISPQLTAVPYLLTDRTSV